MRLWPVMPAICLLPVIALAQGATPPSLAENETHWRESNERGTAALEKGNYQEAETELKSALELASTFSLGDPRLTLSLTSLAELYRSLGRYSESEELFRRALALNEKNVGPNHLVVASNLNNLASVYNLQGKYTDEEPLIERALAIAEKVLDPASLDLSIVMNNLANLYATEGKYPSAEPLYMRSLNIREKVYGEVHPRTAAILEELAALYYAEKKYPESDKYIRRTLSSEEKLYGEHSPRLAPLLEEYADVLQKLGREKDAMKVRERARVLTGPAAPATRTQLSRKPTTEKDKNAPRNVAPNPGNAQLPGKAQPPGKTQPAAQGAKPQSSNAPQAKPGDAKVNSAPKPAPFPWRMW